MQFLNIRVDTFLSGSRDHFLSQGEQLLLFKCTRVSKAGVIRLGAGEGKETTEKGKLEA